MKKNLCYRPWLTCVDFLDDYYDKSGEKDIFNRHQAALSEASRLINEAIVLRKQGFETKSWDESLKLDLEYTDLLDKIDEVLGHLR